MIEALFFFRVLIIATLAAFILSLLNKWGVIEYLQIHAPNNFLNELFSCFFCMSWWTCVFLTLFVLIMYGDCIDLLLPFCATPLTRKLL